jgi:valyl-tRNA synthetase
MATELAKVYDPRSVEGEMQQVWLRAGAFNAEPDGGEGRRGKFCIVIPPPNVTDALHLGHALNNTLQDVLIRYKRMCQLNTLWMPGTDHAGIATQTAVEKRLLAEQGKRRTDFRREDFVALVQRWKDEYEATILNQLKLMGCSCDWRRTRFTMDETCARAVREAFFRLFRDGLIYRGKRLVNWDPATQTVLADDEVEYETIDGHFWYLRYPLVEPVQFAGTRLEHVTVATTRPETMLGDTAVAVNPRDPRADALVGRKVRLPIAGRVIPIIADEHVVLPDANSEDEKARFSTGFLKVTPAHDPDDYAIGERHLEEIARALDGEQAAGGEKAQRQLVFVNVMAPDGTISDQYGWYDCAGSGAEELLGMDRFEAREAVVSFFRREGLLEDVRDYAHQVGHSYRSHVPIEPYLSDQWYIAVRKQIPSLDDAGLIEGTDVPVHSLAGLALKPLLDGRLRFIPERYARTYQTWLAGLRDWPISRQLWWGHRIPIWSQDLKLPDDVAPGAADRHECDARVVAALDAAAGGDFDRDFARFGVRYFLRVAPHPDEGDTVRTYICLDRDCGEAEACIEASGWRRDPDVLDTWFSSALWPFSTMGWPEQTGELKTFYPGDVLCTAREIITLWVSRMVMMGQYCMGDIPFSDVFIHAMIQDGEGRKMSKSLGNGIDPLVVIDSHGADAMRFTLCNMTTQTQDVRMPLEEIALPDGRRVNTSAKFDLGRNFCNKLWNAARFTLTAVEGAPAWSCIRPTEHLADAWILSRLNAAVRDVTIAVEDYRFNELSDTIYHFMWDDFCDWYLEIAKVRIGAGNDTAKAILAHCLDVILRMLHPVAPFVTEAIWQRLNQVVPVRGPGDLPAEPLLVRARWPQADAAAHDPAAEQRFGVLADLIRQIRSVRRDHNVPPRQSVDLLIEAGPPWAALLADHAELIRALAQVGEVRVSREAVARPAEAAAITAGFVKAFVSGVIDREAEIARLQKHKQVLARGIAGAETKLANESFLTKAPPKVVQQQRERLRELQAEMESVQKALAALG